MPVVQFVIMDAFEYHSFISIRFHLPIANNCQQYKSREICIAGNGQILQWDLMRKINILRSWDKKYVYSYTM